MINKNKKALNKIVLINVTSGIISFLVQIIISFFLSPYIISKLGEEAYGFISLANNFVSYVSVLSGAINAMAQRYISIEFNKKNYKNANVFLSSIFFLDFIIGIIMFLVSIYIVVELDNLINISDEFVYQVKITFLLTFINAIITLIGTIFRVATFCTNRMEIDSIRQIFVNILQMILVICLYKYFEPRNYYISMASLIVGITTFVINFYLTKRLTPELQIRIKFFESSKLIILIKDAFWIIVSNVSNLLLVGMDLLVANLLIDGSSMGRLSVAKQIPSALGVLLGTLSAIFQASFVKYVANNEKDELVSELKFTLKLLAVILTVPFAGIIVFGDVFLELWLKERAFSSSEIMQIYTLMILELINTISNSYMYSVHSLFIAYNKIKKYSTIIFISSVASIVFTLLLVKYTNLGIYAVAGTSTIILSIINSIIVPIYAAKIINSKWYFILKITLKSYITLFFVSVIFVAIRLMVNISTWKMFFVECGICGLLGYVISYVFLLGKSQRQRIIETLKNRKIIINRREK